MGNDRSSDSSNGLAEALPFTVDTRDYEDLKPQESALVPTLIAALTSLASILLFAGLRRKKKIQ